MSYKPTISMKAFASPMRYYQGPGITRTVLPTVISALGKKPFICGGAHALAAVERHHLFKALKQSEIEGRVEEFGKNQVWGTECCDEEIARLAEIARNNDCDMILAIGGGKAIDTGKALSNRLALPIISFPTVASTDAPTASVSVIYMRDHTFKGYAFYNRSPDAVIVDTQIIVEAPSRFLACGIGDAFSKKFEVNACYTSGHNNQIVKPFAGVSPLLSANLADLLYNLLRTWGVQAMEDVVNNQVSPALEAVVEGSILLSGLAFESGGLSAAHSIYNGLTVLEEKMHPPQYHGELVHFGTCVQVMLEDHPPEVVYDVFRFGHEIGLPETLEELGLQAATGEDIWKVAEKATAKGETIHKMKREATAEDVVNAIQAVNKYGIKISKQIPRACFHYT